MKRLIFLFAVIATAVVGAKAQEALAVLTHGNTTKTYTGFYALQNAYKDAVSGDLITLSSGTFGATDIAKAVTIRGAGMELDRTYNTQPTIIDGNFTLCIPTTDTGNFQLEGVFHQGTITYNNYPQRNPKFIKCRLDRIQYGTYTSTEDNKTYTCSIKDATFMHCKIVNELSCNANSSMTLINCYVYHPSTKSETTSAMNFINCVVYLDYSNSSSWQASYSKVYSARFTNSIVFCYESYSFNSYYFNSYTLFQNCLINNNINPTYSANNSYWKYTNLSDIFKTYEGTFNSDETFELLDNAKTKYVDEQGRQIGLNGGSFPFSAHVAGPHIKQMQVSPRSTSDGKLNVKMQIENTGY